MGRKKGYKHSLKTKEKIRQKHIGKSSGMAGKTGNKHPNWKNGKCQRKNGRWYIYKPEHPNTTKTNKYIAQSRLIAEKCLDRYLTKKEEIHHINENKSDDRLKNLYLFKSRSEHAQYHGNQYMKKKLPLKSNLIY